MTLALLLAALISGRAEAGVPGAVEAKLLLKLLSFESSKASVHPTQVRIGIVYSAINAKSIEDKNRLVGGIAQIAPSVRLAGRVPTSVPIEASQLTGRGLPPLDILYVTADVDPTPTLAAAAKSGLITACGSRALLERGAIFAVLEKNGHPSLAINFAAAKKTHLKLDPRLVRLMEKL